ncbi:MAG: L,D-transpeptidase [Dehalococcoidia bacterium]
MTRLRDQREPGTLSLPRSALGLAVALLVVLAATFAIGGCGAPTSPAATAEPSTVEQTLARPETANGPAVETTLLVPTSDRWIDVDVTQFSVRLMTGENVLQTISPVAVGRQIDTGAYESTQTGLFHVHVKRAGLSYDEPYDTFIDWWVGFDSERDNGFHSFLLDEHGAVVDDSTGRVSNGCIRTAAAEVIFDFAEVGMPVLVHR